MAGARAFGLLGLLLAAGDASSQDVGIPCFDVPGCGPYYNWLLLNVMLESLSPKERTNFTLPGLNQSWDRALAESINNYDSFAKCEHQATTDGQALTYCVYSLKQTPTANAPVFVSTTCESTVKFHKCLPNEQAFRLSMLEVFTTGTGISDYLKRCPPANMTDAEENLQKVGIVVGSMLQSPSTAGLLSLAIERECGDHHVPVDQPGTIIMAAISCLLIALSVGSELLEYLTRVRAREVKDRSISERPIYEGEPEEKPLLAKTDPTGMASPINQRTFIRYFNFRVNIIELFSSSGARSLGGLDGLKGFSMLWIILAHASLFATFIGTPNPATGKDYFMQEDNYFVVSASFGVDTFYFVSGLLTTYVSISKLRKMSKQPGVAKFFMFLFLRWIRLTPLLAYVIFMYTYVMSVSASGPYWYKMIYETDHCRKLWWSNLLYINNFVPSEFSDQCMAWTWYLANDIQFFIVGLIILFTYVRSPRIGAGIAVAILIVTTIVGYVIAVDFHLGSNNAKFQNFFYDKPYTRIPSYLGGMLFGMALRDTGLKKLRMSALTACVSMTACIGGLVFVFYIQTYRYNMTVGFDQTLEPLRAQWSNEEYAAYLAFGRILYIVCLAGMCALNFSGNGGIVNGFLTLPFWEPVGKLTFGAYLVHPALLRVYYYQQTQPYYFTHINQALIFAGAASISYGIAMLTYVMLELPCDMLIKRMVVFDKRR